MSTFYYIQLIQVFHYLARERVPSDEEVYYSTTAKSVSKRNGMAAEDATSSLETIVISVVIIYRFEV